MADDTVLTNEPATGGLSSAVGPAPGPAPMAESPNARAVAAIPQQAPDLPRFQRTFGNTLKSMLIGLGMGGVPGAVFGAVDPEAIQRARANKQALAQADVTFQNARAAHEVAMAHQADAEYQALPGKLQDEADARGLENLKRARESGYLPVATVPLDQGKDQNSQNAKTALDQIKTQFGAVPSGLLYIHTGSNMTVLKLQDPNAALPAINQARRAQGMKEIDPAAFATLDPKDRDSMARDAINFTDPRDVNGTITQQSLNQANLRLANVKGQPEFNGKDALVTQLQATVDHQKSVLESGAKEAGTTKGIEAQAAEPGTTAAEVSKQTTLSQTPTGKLETAQKRANLAQTQATTAKTIEETKQLKGMEGLVDPFGEPVGKTSTGQQLTKKEFDASGKTFAKDYIEPLNVLAKTTQEFQRIDQNPNQTGAEKVTALLNAVGISGDPLKGKGFRISNQIIEEHAQSRNIWESGVQKLNRIVGSGGPITSQQISDYRAVAEGVVHDAYVTAAQEARRQGLPVDFLPKATRPNQVVDKMTAKIYLDSAGGDQGKALKAIQAAGYQ